MLKKFRKQLKLQLSYLKRQVITPPFPKNSNGKVLLHIGCGETNSPEFINVDARPFAHVHIVTDDITSLPNFGAATVDLVYMCHILEHIKRDNIKKVFSEMKRILKIGGVLRLSVPDFDRLIEVYNASGKDINAICHQLMGGQDNEYNIHYSVFNHQLLTEVLQEAGFREVLPWDPNNCQYHDFRDRATRKLRVDSREYPISLNLEAIK